MGRTWSPGLSLPIPKVKRFVKRGRAKENRSHVQSKLRLRRCISSIGLGNVTDLLTSINKWHIFASPLLFRQPGSIWHYTTSRTKRKRRGSPEALKATTRRPSAATVLLLTRSEGYGTEWGFIRSNWLNWGIEQIERASTHAVDRFGRSGLEQWNQSRHHCSKNNLYHSRRWLSVASNSSWEINQLHYYEYLRKMKRQIHSYQPDRFFCIMANHIVWQNHFNYIVTTILQQSEFASHAWIKEFRNYPKKNVKLVFVLA